MDTNFIIRKGNTVLHVLAQQYIGITLHDCRIRLAKFLIYNYAWERMIK